MSRFLLQLLLTTTTLVAQTSLAPKRAPTPPANDDNRIGQISALQNRASHILKGELSRKLNPTCDPAKLSNAEFGNCFNADAEITEHNYLAFVQALKASLAIKPPELDPTFPLPSRNFAAGEAAWRSYLDKVCEARGDTEYGASGTPTDMTACQQNLTRQHMKDLNEIFLKR